MTLFLAMCLSACGAGAASVSKPTATNTAPAVTATPTPAQHHIYVGVESLNGGGPFAVAALQSRDGSPLWQRPISGGGPINVLVSDDTIVAVQDRQLTALQASDGKILWQTSTHYNYLRAIVTDGMIIEGSDASYQSNSYVDAYRISDGKRLWEYNGNTCSLGQIVGNTTDFPQVGALAGNAVYIRISCSSDALSGLLALRVSDGTVLWKNQLAKFPQLNTPVLVNGVLYANTVLGAIYAVRASDGSQLWHTQLSGTSPADSAQGGFAPIVTDGTAGYIAANSNSDLFAFRLSDGTQLWTTHYNKYETWVAKAADGVVYLQGDTGLHLLRASDGSEIWGTASGGNYSFPATTADAIYVIHGPPSASAFPTPYAVYALKSTDGSTLWSYDGNGHAFTCLAID